MYKCSTYLIPANLTAGECCDRCAPAGDEPTANTTKKITAQPRKTNLKPSLFNRKPEKSRLIHVLIEPLSRFYRKQSHGQLCSCSESHEDK